jgi:PGF-CTERM protein
MNRVIASVGIVAVLLSVLLMTGGAAAQQAEAHNGSNVNFQTTDNAVVDYRVNGVALVESVKTEAQDTTEQRGGMGVGATISSNARVRGATISAAAQTQTRTSFETGSGAAMQAHDSDRGNLLVRATGGDQLVGLNVSDGVQAEQASDRRAVVTHTDGTQGVIVVIGNGSAIVNEEGNVVADVADGSALVYRQYGSERSDEERAQERMIADGTAAAEVYVTAPSDGNDQPATDAIQYEQDTAVTVGMANDTAIKMTADRDAADGRIVISSVSEAAFDTASEINVTVDGTAATRAESTDALRTAADGGTNSAFMIRSATTTTASTDVVIAINHFSDRDLTITTGDDETTISGEDDSSTTNDTSATDDSSTTDEDTPGFGVIVAIVAILSASLIAVNRRRN